MTKVTHLTNCFMWPLSRPSSWTCFSFISATNNKRLQAWSLLLCIWKHTSLCNKGVSSFIIPCKFHDQLNPVTNWVQVLTGLLFYAFVGIQQVRILVFDNYQTSPVPLSLPILNKIHKSMSGALLFLLNKLKKKRCSF